MFAGVAFFAIAGLYLSMRSDRKRGLLLSVSFVLMLLIGWILWMVWPGRLAG